MSRIEAVSAHFDSTYRDLVLGAFRGPSQQLRFQPPVFSFDTPTIDIDIGAPMDVSPPPAFGDAEPVVPAAREKGKARAIESPTKKEETEESKQPWERKIFNMTLHDERQPPVSGEVASHDFLFNLCFSANAALSEISFAFSRSRSFCRLLARIRARRFAAIAAGTSDKSARCPRNSLRRRSRGFRRSPRSRRGSHRVARSVKRDRSARSRRFLRVRRRSSETYARGARPALAVRDPSSWFRLSQDLISESASRRSLRPLRRRSLRKFRELHRCLPFRRTLPSPDPI